MANLVSSVPGVFQALLELARTAGHEQDTPVYVTPFELEGYEPASYVMVSEIRGPRYEWESIGSFSQKEIYEIHGKATVFTGDAPDPSEPLLAVTVMQETFTLFWACVMTPIMSNRDMPILGTTGPSPYLMLPLETSYKSGPGVLGDAPAGWEGTLDWAFRFEAIVTPA